jgi:hypothetical protein
MWYWKQHLKTEKKSEWALIGDANAEEQLFRNEANSKQHKGL